MYNLLQMIDTLPRDALATGAATAESVLAAVTMVAPGIDPDQAFGHAWSLETAIARYAAGDGQFAHCGPTGP